MLLRPCAICTAAGSVIAMAFSLWFLIAAFTEYRAPDFEYASFSTDMSKVTTCMETVSQKTFEDKGWHKLAEEGGCDEGKRDALAAALRVSVHPLVYAWQKRVARNDNVSLALGFALPSIVMPPEQWSPTLNEKNGGAAHIRFQDKAAGWDDAIPQIHAERIYAALETLAGTGAVPSADGCRLTYPAGVYNEEYAIRVRAAYNSSGATQVPVHDIATTCAGSNPPDEEWKTTSGGVETRVIWGGLVGDYVAAAADPTDTPNCPAGRSTAGFHSTGSSGDLCFSDAERDLLYTHCVLQFRFGSSGEESNTGMPDVNKNPQPMLDVSDWIEGAEDAKTDYTTRVRLQLGTKFGNAVAFYTVMLALCAFLLADAFVALLIEVTYPERLLAILGQSTGINARIFDILRLRSTMNFTRGERFVLAIVGVTVATVSFAAFRNDFTPDKKRPYCAAPDAATADDDANQIGWHSVNSGGWQTDAMPAYYEELALIFAWAVVVLLPLAEFLGHFLDRFIFQPGLGCVNNVFTAGSESTNDADQALERPKPDSTVTTARPVGGVEALSGAIMLLAVAGTLFLVVAEANVAAAMGVSWAEGLIGLEAHHREYYDSHLLFGLLYRQALLTGAVAITAGWVSGAALSGLGMQGVGGVTLIALFLWLLVAVFGFLPLLLYRDIVGEPFDRDDSLADCKKVWWDPMLKPSATEDPEGDWRAEMGGGGSACDARYWFYIVGVVVLLLAFLISFLFMLFITLRRCSEKKSDTEPGEISAELEQAVSAESVALDSSDVVRIRDRYKGTRAAQGAHASLQSVRVRPNAKASAARYAPAPRAGVASIERPACPQVLPTVASGAERHQERLAALLLSPQGQAATSVPLMAVSRR